MSLKTITTNAMHALTAPRLPLLIAVILGCSVESGIGVTLYRIGAPFTAAEEDSLTAVGVEFIEVSWSASQLETALEVDSLQAGSLQPDFFDQDEDIAASLLGRGGKVWIKLFAHEDRLIGLPLVDRDPSTSSTWPAIAPESFLRSTNNETFQEKLTFDLGGRFLIREVRFRPLAERPDHFLESFALGISDTGFDVYRIPFFTRILDVKENTEPDVRLILNPPVTTEAVQLRIFRQTPKEIGIADLELLGGGFVSNASYESDIIELEDIASWGEIRWSGRRDPHARVDIRTRTGVDPQPEVFWESRPEQQDSVQFQRGGGDLSFSDYKSQYAKLKDFLKPVDPLDWVSLDAENWSFWSSPYPFDRPGVAIVSPGPRRFIQIKADFGSTIEDGGKIDYIEFKASVPPAVRGLVGEIFPTETVVGEPTRFTYYIRPTIRTGDSSFDGVEISTPTGVVSVDSLRLGGIDSGFHTMIREDGLGFEVRLPRKLETTDSGSLVEVVFEAPILREVGTLFNGKIFDSSKPDEVRQRINPGDAADEVDSDRLSVTTSLSPSVVFSPQIAPNPFTPNGDGVNDVTNISYKLLRVTAAVPVAIEVFDLSGRLVRQIYSGEDPLGEYDHTWDGTDSFNRVVAPGVYLYRMIVDVQSAKETQTGLISLAY